MSNFVALLRGINVSGHRSIPMAKLKESLEGLGFREVRTYLQSGNVVFRAGHGQPRPLAVAISERIAAEFGHEVAVLVWKARALQELAEANPLYPRLSGDARLFHCTFLFDSVPERAFAALQLPTRAQEQAVLAGSAVLLYCPDGYGRTRLTNGYFEKVLGTRATTRNWRTVLALRDLCGERC